MVASRSSVWLLGPRLRPPASPCAQEVFFFFFCVVGVSQEGVVADDAGRQRVGFYPGSRRDECVIGVVKSLLALLVLVLVLVLG